MYYTTHNTCHICLKSISDSELSMIKCKLCCDGWEHDACKDCTKLYHEYKQQITNKVKSNQLFNRLQQKRHEGIINEKSRR